MSVKMRAVLSTMPAYVAGRTVPGAIKLASNETAYPVLPARRRADRRGAAGANRYPDNGRVGLTTALAERYGVATDRVAVGCGSVALCQQLVRVVAGAGDEMIYPWRSFEAYPIVTRSPGRRRCRCR